MSSQLKMYNTLGFFDPNRIREHYRPNLELARNEGLPLGPSSGVNIAGAIRLARVLGPGHTVATLLCDPGHRYAGKIYNPAFLRSKGFNVPTWLEGA